MITESILIVFAIVYYLFSVAMFGAYVQDVEDISFTSNIGKLITTIIFSPIATPIILGIEIGEAIKES